MKSCPDCRFTRTWSLADGRLKCHRCGTRYRPPAHGSIWAAFRLSPTVKRRLLDYFLLGVPSYRLRRHGLASAPTRERFFRAIRAAMAYEERLRKPFDGLVELDETTFGGHRPGKRGWGAAGKIIVFGILKRNGLVRLCPVARRTKKDVIREIRLHTKPGSLYCGRRTLLWLSAANTWSSRRSAANPGAKRRSMALKASGAMPNTGSICTGECHRNWSISTWGKFPTASIIAMRSFSHWYTGSYDA